MIVTALILIAIGTADLIRQFVVPRWRRLALAIAGVAVILLSVFAGAWPAGVLAVALAAAWIWLLPNHSAARARFWPVIGLAVICGGFVAVLGSRHDAGLLGGVWSFPSPLGTLSLDKALLTVGVVLFLLESANIIVRTALSDELLSDEQLRDEELGAESPGSKSPMDAAATASARAEGEASTVIVQPKKTLKGGRLIGPLERVLVFTLTLSGIYTILAAILAAKGIVRFPEISRDGDGNRAEYFLVGSMVSWVIALAAAFLVWWGFSTPGA